VGQTARPSWADAHSFREKEIEVSDLDSIHSFINRKMMDEITPRE
jgi:hypothetical protein